MKSLFRSEKMQHCEMILHAESAFECLIQLGYLGAVQFINQPSTEDEQHNRYQREIQRCNEMLRMLNQMEHESHAAGMQNFYYPEVDLEDVPQINDMNNIETKIHELNEDLLEIDRNTFGLKRREMALKEEYYVLNHVEDMLRGQHNTERIMAWSDSVIMNLIKDETTAFTHEVRTAEQKLRFYAGTVPVERFASFETMLFRVCHHNFYIQKENIPEAIEDAQGVPIRKYAFMVAFVGERIGQLINKVCQGFRVRSIHVSESSEDRKAKMEDILTDLNNFKQIYERTQFERNQILAVAGGDLFIWKVKLLKMLAIYTELNQMSIFDGLDSQKYLKARCWVPAKDIKRVRKALLRGARRAARGDMSMMFPPSLVERSNRLIDQNPPTSINLNRFTNAFQKLIDAYGLPAYQELNPAPYTVITFPFLFAVMFGDLGHGFIMFLFAAWMVKNEVQFEENKKKTKKSNEIWDILFSGRYIILLMGLFSMYTGFIYNDVFSLTFNIFGSSWKVSKETADSVLNEAGKQRFSNGGPNDFIIFLNPASKTEYEGTPYIMGIDPVWHMAENNILYDNSYKMKLSIILGVVHMIFGLALFACNCVYTRNAVDFYLIFIPQLTFLLCVFGYLVVLMIYKWWAFGGHLDTPYNTACAPSVLITFINMLLFKDIPKAGRGCEEEMFTGQEILQYFLVFMALLSIPVLLAGKPLHFMRKQRKIRKEQDEKKRWGLRQETAEAWRKSLLTLDENESTIREEEVENIDLTEMWIHSGIHTIECVLGAISHTASYLRLWALSLAHDQLSKVLWDFLMRSALRGGGLVNAAFLIVVFCPWASLTLAIMIVMEGLSAFLHCLRLHWVEFQSKFYAGTGMPFRPFLFTDASEVDLL